MNIKKNAVIIVVILILVLTTFVSARDIKLEAIVAEFPIILNEEQLQYKKNVVTIEGNAYVPLRETADMLGFNTIWNEEKQRVELKVESQQIDFHGRGNSPEIPVQVSIISLIATPERYHNKYIRVIGVWNLEFEGDGLYLSKDDWNYGTYNGVAISFPNEFYVSNEYEEAKSLNGKFVEIYGKFDANYPLYSIYGTIRDITSYIEVETAEPYPTSEP